MNERKTEKLVTRRLDKLGYYSSKLITVEEQQSDSPRISKLLKMASKHGKGGGHPEFIVWSSAASDFMIIIECKADVRKHRSKSGEKYEEYAVDGVLLYASYLSREFDVLAIAISGQTAATMRISHYLHLRGAESAMEFPGDTILSFDNYYHAYLNNEVKLRQDYDALLAYSRELNEDLHAVKIPEAQRSMLICGILVALENAAFRKSYKVHKTAQELADHLVESVINEFKRSGLGADGIRNLEQAFSFIRVNATLTSDKDFVVGLIEEIDQNVTRFRPTHQFYDAIGQFYVQFLRYANNDKGLGIVLTPPHIAELFADLAQVTKKSVVYDNCCGTAGLLIAAMKRMLKDARSNEETERSIKNRQLIGVEFQPHIYALAVSNMVVHRDGKTNIKNGDCFALAEEIRNKFEPDVGILNPPYQTKNNPIHELEFVLNNLEALQPNSKCVAIVPFGCAIGDDKETLEKKRRILDAHSLEAVMTMAAELFHDSNANVATCIMVITAHNPHPAGKKTWFGYWRDDGFVKVKNRGRIDKNGTWESVKTTWLTAYCNRTEIPGLSVMQAVDAESEWCGEAYMQPDWSQFGFEEIAKTFKEFAVHRMMLDAVPDWIAFTRSGNGSHKVVRWLPPSMTKQWGEFRDFKRVEDMFHVEYGSSYELNHLEEDPNGIAFVSRTSRNNGISGRVKHTGEDPTPRGCLTVALGGSVLETFYQEEATYQGRDVAVLIPKEKMSVEEMLWYATAIRQHQFRFNYGRQANRQLPGLLIPIFPARNST